MLNISKDQLKCPHHINVRKRGRVFLWHKNGKTKVCSGDPAVLSVSENLHNVDEKAHEIKGISVKSERETGISRSAELQTIRQI